jgi:hypothetical protein
MPFPKRIKYLAGFISKTPDIPAFIGALLKLYQYRL